MDLRAEIIKLAKTVPETRVYLIPILKAASENEFTLGSKTMHPTPGYLGVKEPSLESVLKRLSRMAGLLADQVTLFKNNSAIGDVRSMNDQETRHYPAMNNMKIVLLDDHDEHPYKWAVGGGKVIVLH